MKLKDKVAIITGAGHGIGRAIALRFTKEGASIVVPDIDFEAANEVVKEIKASGGKAIATKTDVRDSEQVKELVKAALDEFGQIDILVNNAGGAARGKLFLFHETPEENFHYVIGNNLMTTLLCSRAVIGHMMQRRTGRILCACSIAGVAGKGDEGGVEYSTAKAGLIGFAKSLAKQVGRYGITVNCYSAGATQTRAQAAMAKRFEEMVKRNYMGRLGQPEDIAAVVTFLASDEASWITGQNYIVDGGDSLGWV